MKTKVIVCGGRNFNNKDVVFTVLSKLNPDIVIHGGATGADELAGQWACENEKEVRVYQAAWSVHGKYAGPFRNKKMLNEELEGLSGVIAFPGGKGTDNMVKLATAALGENKVVKVNIK